MSRSTPAKIRNTRASISRDAERASQDGERVNVAVAEKMCELHDALAESGYRGHQLAVILVRLAYCLFADHMSIFPRDHFRRLLEEQANGSGAHTGGMSNPLFQILDTPKATRRSKHGEESPQFPHVNSALFRQQMDPPCLGQKTRRILLEACAFDWSKVSPAILGSLFQPAMDRERRRNLGAHYTDEQNILKVVRGLFLEDFYAEFASIKHDAARLRRFHERLAWLKFFDPSCGSGNFLVIAYREVRRLEI
ncbi:MAG TPA: type IIL restriction-modification enzyme MmeI, partial [Pyrinomonadaceae bacterium]